MNNNNSQQGGYYGSTDFLSGANDAGSDFNNMPGISQMPLTSFMSSAFTLLSII